MQSDRLKCLELAERLEDRAIKFIAQVHFTRKPVPFEDVPECPTREPSRDHTVLPAPARWTARFGD